MARKIIIDPVTRVEGHGKITIQVDDHNKVQDAFFHIVEFRGFERFIQGHPYWEAPVLVQRLCGICPVSHHLAAAKAIDQIVGVDPEDLTPTAKKLRKLLHYGQIFQSHALHFFYLAAPDLLLGTDSDPKRRNVVGVAMDYPEIAKKGILMRKFGQEIIKATAGKRIHGIAACPGGVHKNLSPNERLRFLQGESELPSINTMIEWMLEILRFMKNYHAQHDDFLNNFAAYPSGHLGLVDEEGRLELYDGKLRAIDAEGMVTLDDIPDVDYQKHFFESVEKWSYLKFPYLKHIGREKGWNRVGPLARLNICKSISTPLAEKERLEYFNFSGVAVNNMTMHTHWARLIEMLHCAELIKDLLEDNELSGRELITEGIRREEGVGVIEAPRGTLIHHYRVDGQGKITRCNLIVSTTHNNQAMNEAVKWVAENEISGEAIITEAMMNNVEVAVRAYDPCLSCATHAMGKMPLQIRIENLKGEILNEKFRN